MRAVLAVVLLGVASALKLSPQETFGSPELTKIEWPGKPQVPVFYMTAMSKLANKHQTRLWLQSLRHTGKWMGDVVIVTDKPKCLENNFGLALLGGARIDEKDDIIVYPGGEGMGKVYFIKAQTTHDVKKMKQEKAMAWINIRSVGLNPTYIVHTDQDIVFGNDVNTIVSSVNALEPGYTLALFIDQGVTKGQLHTGIIFLMSGEKTDKCLADWAVQILQTRASPYHGFNQLEPEVMEPDLNKLEPGVMQPDLNKLEAEMMGPDQRALGKTGSCKAGKGIHLLPKKDLMMPTKGTLGNGKTATFIHFTNTNRWKTIKPEIKKEYFTSVLGLPEMEWFDYETCEYEAQDNDQDEIDEEKDVQASQQKKKHHKSQHHESPAGKLAKNVKKMFR
jgi:hypothetical protein